MFLAQLCVPKNLIRVDDVMESPTPWPSCAAARHLVAASRGSRLAQCRYDQLWMSFTVEIGQRPSCPLIEMRSPCTSSRKTCLTVHHCDTLVGSRLRKLTCRNFQPFIISYSR